MIFVKIYKIEVLSSEQINVNYPGSFNYSPLPGCKFLIYLTVSQVDLKTEKNVQQTY
jgi:hypothetical protein